jgi:hypothetical protein
LNAVGGGNPSGLAPILSSRDAVLLESFGGAAGRREPQDELRRRLDAVVAGRERYGTAIYAVAGASFSADQREAEYLWWLAALFGLDAFGISDADYSAPSSRLSWWDRPLAEAVLRRGESIDAAPTFTTGAWYRRTTTGRIAIDPIARTGALGLR